MKKNNIFKEVLNNILISNIQEKLEELSAYRTIHHTALNNLHFKLRNELKFDVAIRLHNIIQNKN